MTRLAEDRCRTAPGVPGWRVWRSSKGRWWATRTGRGAQWRDETGVPMTVDAGSEAELRELLAVYAEETAP